MLNQIIVFLAVLSCTSIFVYLAYWGWKEMKSHEPDSSK